MSQSKEAKAATVKGREEAPAAPQPAPEPPPQPRDATRAEKEEIVYLKLSELFPFKEEDFSEYDEPEDYDDAPPWDVDDEDEGGDE